MGIFITYEGGLDEAGRVNELIQDLKLRCRRLEWGCKEVNERIIGDAYYFAGQREEDDEESGRKKVVEVIELRPVDDRMRGVYIKPPHLGTLILTFDRAGRLMHYRALPGQITSKKTSFGNLMDYTDEPGYYMATDQNWIKTTGQIATHVLIVTLFRYIQQNYMSNLEIDDPTEYWDTQDIDTLQLEHARMGAIIGLFREPENVKSLLKLAGFEDVEQVTPVPPEELNLRASKPEHMKDWGIAAHEN